MLVAGSRGSSRYGHGVFQFTLSQVWAEIGAVLVAVAMRCSAACFCASGFVVLADARTPSRVISYFKFMVAQVPKSGPWAPGILLIYSVRRFTNRSVKRATECKNYIED
jgi:hypothetical protein